MGMEFFQTPLGRKFFECDFPELITTLKSIANGLNMPLANESVKCSQEEDVLNIYAKMQKSDSFPLLPCPRCGANSMRESLHTNALSRHADIYVCSRCGTDEALLDMNRTPKPFSEWFVCKQLMKREEKK